MKTDVGVEEVNLGAWDHAWDPALDPVWGLVGVLLAD